MSQKELRAAVVYMSPAGTTRHVAQTLAQALEAEQWKVEVFDLSHREHRNPSLIEKALGSGGCLWVGSPVYARRALPPVVQFLTQLPSAQGRYGVPFVTWGGVTSGIALLDLVESLKQRGYAILGAAKIMAVHSMLWLSEHPLGEGHPNSDDDALIRELAKAVTSKLKGPQPSQLSPQSSHYQPPDIELKAQSANIDGIKKEFASKKKLDDKLCNQCGICMQECPVGAIELNTLPQFGEDCIACYNCVRLCPEGAIKFDLSGWAERLKKRSQEFAEHPGSQIFI